MIECECADAGPALSVVVPVHNESGNIAPLVSEIVATLDGSIDFEIVVIDDGSSDDTLARLKDLALHEPRLHGWHHRANCGQSTALHTGVRRARAPLVATLDGDGQNDPADIPRLLERWRRERAVTDGALLLTGWRASRHDTWLRRASSRIANRVRSALLHDDTPDTGCGLKLFERASFLALPYFDHMHRFLPALVLRHGGRVVSVPVNHRPRSRGQSHYGVGNRLWVGLMDLLGVMWLRRRRRLTTVDRVVATKGVSVDGT